MATATALFNRFAGIAGSTHSMNILVPLRLQRDVAVEYRASLNPKGMARRNSAHARAL